MPTAKPHANFEHPASRGEAPLTIGLSHMLPQASD
jgi:hypothetical protein